MPIAAGATEVRRLRVDHRARKREAIFDRAGAPARTVRGSVTLWRDRTDTDWRQLPALREAGLCAAHRAAGFARPACRRADAQRLAV